MVITTLEAEVSPMKWNDLKKAFENMLKNAHTGMITPTQAWLLQSNEDVNVWRLMGLWTSMEEFNRMREKGTPRGIQIFRDLGAEPSLSIYEVVATMAIGEAMPMSQH